MAVHRAGKEKLKAGLGHFLEAGRRLIRKKAEVTGGKYRGGWGHWLKTNVDFGWTQACRYMKFSRDVENRFGAEFSPGENSDADDEFSQLWERTRSGPPEEDESLNTAYHEAGHAVVAYLGGAKIDEVTIDGERAASRYDWRLPVSGHVTYLPHDRDLLWVFATKAAGPVAEAKIRGVGVHALLQSENLLGFLAGCPWLARSANSDPRRCRRSASSSLSIITPKSPRSCSTTMPYGQR
jgi:hypothetical protein